MFTPSDPNLPNAFTTSSTMSAIAPSSSPDPFGANAGVPNAAILPLVLANVILLCALVGLFIVCCRQKSLPSFRSKVPHLDREGLRPADPRMLDPLRRYSRRRRHDELSSLPNDTPTLPRYATMTGSLMRSLGRLASFGRSQSHTTANVNDAAAMAAQAAEAGTAAPQYRTLDHETEQHLAVALSTLLPTATGTSGRDTLRSTASSVSPSSCDRPPPCQGQVLINPIPHIPPPLAPPPPPSNPVAFTPPVPPLPRSASIGSYPVPIGARPQLSTITERDEDAVSLIPPTLARSVQQSPNPVSGCFDSAAGADARQPLEQGDMPSVDLRMLAEGQHRSLVFGPLPNSGGGSLGGAGLSGRQSA